MANPKPTTFVIDWPLPNGATTPEDASVLHPGLSEGDREDITVCCLKRADAIIELLQSDCEEGHFTLNGRVIQNALWALSGIIQQAQAACNLSPRGKVTGGNGSEDLLVKMGNRDE